MIKIIKENEQNLIGDFLEWLSVRDADNYELVTFNGKSFDENFILSRLAQKIDLSKETGLFLLDYEHLDLFEEIRNRTGKRMGLDAVAKIFGCSSKSGTGISAIKLWKDAKFRELQDYCMQDVEVTEEVYQKLLEKR